MPLWLPSRGLIAASARAPSQMIATECKTKLRAGSVQPARTGFNYRPAAGILSLVTDTRLFRTRENCSELTIALSTPAARHRPGEAPLPDPQRGMLCPHVEPAHRARLTRWRRALC